MNIIFVIVCFIDIFLNVSATDPLQITACNLLAWGWVVHNCIRSIMALKLVRFSCVFNAFLCVYSHLNRTTSRGIYPAWRWIDASINGLISSHAQITCIVIAQVWPIYTCVFNAFSYIVPSNLIRLASLSRVCGWSCNVMTSSVSWFLDSLVPSWFRYNLVPI